MIALHLIDGAGPSIEDSLRVALSCRKQRPEFMTHVGDQVRLDLENRLELVSRPAKLFQVTQRSKKGGRAQRQEPERSQSLGKWRVCPPRHDAHHALQARLVNHRNHPETRGRARCNAPSCTRCRTSVL